MNTQSAASPKYSGRDLSAIFSNLEKAAVKQNRAEEAGLFGKLAAYYQKAELSMGKDQNQAPKPGAFEALALAVKQQTAEAYPAAFEIARADADRGALRALTWGEKVTKIQASLLSRYEKQQDTLLAGTSLFVCDICGFVYVGDAPPAICPICKVPSVKIVEYK